jgi:hypothetical protein
MLYYYLLLVDLRSASSRLYKSAILSTCSIYSVLEEYQEKVALDAERAEYIV